MIRVYYAPCVDELFTLDTKLPRKIKPGDLAKLYLEGKFLMDVVYIGVL